MNESEFCYQCIMTFTFWSKIHRAHPQLMGVFVWSFMMIGVKRKQLCYICTQCIVILTFDLLTPKSKGHILDSWGVNWFMSHNCFLTIIMKLHTKTPNEWKMCPIDIRFKRWKVKLTMHWLLKMGFFGIYTCNHQTLLTDSLWVQDCPILVYFSFGSAFQIEIVKLLF